MSFRVLLLFAVLLLHTAQAAPPTDPSKPISRFAFGSCNNQDEPQDIWQSIIRYKPDLWLWLGDIVYADKRIVPFYRVPSPLPVMEQVYQKQKNGELYQKLMKTTPIVGIYDDHDYGLNNGGIEYNDKEDARKLLLKFLDEPTGSPRWARRGAYTSYVLGPSGQQAKFIFLDTRYNREYPTDEADMLGDEQWAWLEAELRGSNADVNFVISSIQVLPHDKPFQEKWANFPRSRERLLSLLLQPNVRNPILLSGDVHYGELFALSCADEKGNKRTLYEMTSSGMTHACAMQYPGGLCELILSTIMTSAHRVQSFYPFRNFGSVEIDWNAKPFVVKLQVRDMNGTVQAEQQVLDSSSTPALRGAYDCLNDWKSVGSWVRWRLESWVFFMLVTFLSGVVLIFIVAISMLSGKKQANNRAKRKTN